MLRLLREVLIKGNAVPDMWFLNLYMKNGNEEVRNYLCLHVMSSVVVLGNWSFLSKLQKIGLYGHSQRN